MLLPSLTLTRLIRIYSAPPSPAYYSRLHSQSPGRAGYLLRRRRPCSSAEQARRHYKGLVFVMEEKGGDGDLLWDDPEKKEGVEVVVADILEVGEVFVQP